MTNNEKFSKLDYFEDEFRVGVELCIFDCLFNHLFKSHITVTWHVDSWEQIREQSSENVSILSDDFGDIEITKSSEQDSKLALAGLGTLE